jgi:hypothetical protein
MSTCKFALLAFLELKRSHLHIVSVLNKQRIKPHNILMQVCLLVNIWVAVIGSFLTIDARMEACYEKGRFTKYRALLAGPLFFPWACTRARVYTVYPVYN